MSLESLKAFEEALLAHDAKVVMPTDLTSAEIRAAMPAMARRRAFFSSQTMFSDLLDGYKEKVGSILNPITEQRADRVTAENPQGNVTTGLNPTYARMEIKELLRSLEYHPEAGEEGTIKDLSSDARINLVLDTNVQTAQGAGRFIQANDADVVDEFPAQELYRLEETAKQRDWPARWRAAAEESGDDDALRVLDETGRMVALKASPIWDSLGDGAGGYSDTLGNPYPPFAFNSGMWTQSVGRDDAEALGLINAGQKAESHPLDLENLFALAE